MNKFWSITSAMVSGWYIGILMYDELEWLYVFYAIALLIVSIIYNGMVSKKK